MRFTGFIGPSYTLSSVNVDCQRCLNMYPELNELGTGKEREVASLVGTPGLRLLLTLATSPVRGIFTASTGVLYVVGGDKLYSVSSSWVATELGTLNTISGPVSMADNGLHLVIVDGTDGYTLTFAGTVFDEITDPDFFTADQVTFQDGYFIANKKGSQQFFISGLNDITWDALDIASVEGSPDDLIALVSMNQSLYLFGSQSTEVFYNSGDADFPFVRQAGAVNDIGLYAGFSLVKLGNSACWVGGDENGYGIVYRMTGFQAQRISTPAVESVIKSLTTDQVASARAWGYQQGGHEFYVLNIPGATSTWVYDTQTSLWHERSYLNLWSDERHRADCHALAYGLNVVGDYQNGKVYALDPMKYTDDGTYIARERVAPHISDGPEFMSHFSFQLDMETGVGLDGTAQGTDPQAMIRWSNDGGHNWSNEYWAAIGKIGQRMARVIWRRLGIARDRVYKVRITDPVKVVMIGAWLGIEKGAA